MHYDNSRSGQIDGIGRLICRVIEGRSLSLLLLMVAGSLSGCESGAPLPPATPDFSLSVSLLPVPGYQLELTRLSDDRSADQGQVAGRGSKT